MFTFPVSHWAVGFKNTYSMVFDGVDEWVDIPYGTEFDFIQSSTFSISCWARFTTMDTYDYLVSTLDSPNFNGFAFYKEDINKIQFYFQGTLGTIQVRNDTALLVNTWYNIVLTYNGVDANGVNIYVNNTTNNSVLSNQTLGDTSHVNNLAIGIRQGAVKAHPMVGNIDEVSVWNVELSATDVTNLYNSGKPNNLNTHAKSANLIGWWRMGEGATFSTPNWTIPDDSTNNNSGTSTNMEEADRVTVVP